jgi:hypothetical protein
MGFLKILIYKFGNLKMKLSFLQINAKVEYYTKYDEFLIINRSLTLKKKIEQFCKIFATFQKFDGKFSQLFRIPDYSHVKFSKSDVFKKKSLRMFRKLLL